MGRSRRLRSGNCSPRGGGPNCWIRRGRALSGFKEVSRIQHRDTENWRTSTDRFSAEVISWLLLCVSVVNPSALLHCEDNQRRARRPIHRPAARTIPHRRPTSLYSSVSASRAAYSSSSCIRSERSRWIRVRQLQLPVLAASRRDQRLRESEVMTSLPEIPEPGTLFVFLTGLLGLAMVQRRRPW